MENDASGVNTESSSEGDQGKVDNQADKVSYESYQKLLGQLKNTSALNKELSAKLTDFETQHRQTEESKLVEKGEFKKIIELREQQINELQNKMTEVINEKETTSKRLQDTFKMQSFYSKLPGKIKNQDYLSFADIDSIAIDPDSGLPDAKSVEMAVDKFMKQHSSLVEVNNVPTLPANSPNSKSIATSDFSKMNLKDMKTNLKDMLRREKAKLGLT